MGIVLTDVTKRFGGKLVLDRFSASLPDSGAVAVTGPSGAGKTTFVNLLMGLVKPDSGRVEGLEGLTFTAVFQEDRLFDVMSVKKNIRLARRGRTTDREIASHLKEVGLGAELYSRAGELSGGMKRRVALVRAVFAAGDVLVLDEPFRGIDDAMRVQCAGYIMRRASGRLIVLVTHDLAEAEMLRAEKIIRIGRADEPS